MHRLDLLKHTLFSISLAIKSEKKTNLLIMITQKFFTIELFSYQISCKWLTGHLQHFSGSCNVIIRIESVSKKLQMARHCFKDF